MNILERETAEAYASWFRCVADPTRLQILHALAGADRPMRVGEVADAVGVAQSTVSAHLRRLLDERFVLVERSGTASWFVVNEACIREFPAAARRVIAGLTGDDPLVPTATRPWEAASSEPGTPAVARTGTAGPP